MDTGRSIHSLEDTSHKMKRNDSLKPLFIFSLPRSGSTLLQRILGADKSISFTGEPWFLLPFFYSLKNKGVVAEYNHQVMFQGVHSLGDNLTGGTQVYKQEIKELANRLYQHASSDNAKYFIDKTPRYHFIVDEILDVFEDAKFIFLWRHPLAIPASCIETWGKGKWNPYYFDCDLYGGLERLLAAYEANQERVWAINYEQLVTNPQATLKSLLENYLKIEFDPDITTKFNHLKLKGRMWDPTGVKRYSSVDTRPLQKWKSTMGGVLRQRWCHNYLDWIGNKRLEIMGYDLEELHAEVTEIPGSLSGLGTDLVRMFHGKACRRFESRLFNGNMPFVMRQ